MYIERRKNSFFIFCYISDENLLFFFFMFSCVVRISEIKCVYMRVCIICLDEKQKEILVINNNKIIILIIQKIKRKREREREKNKNKYYTTFYIYSFY
jgi:hypothetical protein